MNRLIKFPQLYALRPQEGPVIYVAGDNSDEDWQSVAVALLMASPRPVVVIPSGRVEAPSVGAPADADRVNWETVHGGLYGAITLIWFPASKADHPLTWMDFAAALVDERQLMVGCHPRYRRAEDVKLRWRAYRGTARLYPTLPELVEATLTRADMQANNAAIQQVRGMQLG